MRELYPSWSRDSKQIIFTTWNDNDLGAIHSIDVASKKITTHTKNPGHYKNGQPILAYMCKPQTQMRPYMLANLARWPDDCL